MEIHEMVMKLTGPIRAVGETNEDARRHDNLEVLIDVLEHLLNEVSDAATAATRQEASMQKIGVTARDFLRNWPDQI